MPRSRKPAEPVPPPDSSPPPAQTCAVRIGSSFDEAPQSGARLDQPMIAMLTAVRDAGSLKQAADRLGRSYRHVWGQLREWEIALGASLVTWSRGAPARLTPFAERLLWAEVRARRRMQPHIEALRAHLEQALAEARADSPMLLRICASHDLALPALRTLAGRRGLGIELMTQGSIDALRSLNAGRCLVAGFHVPALAGAAPDIARAIKPLLRPGQHKLIGCSRRTQGLMMRHEFAGIVEGPGDIAPSGLRFINRQLGSGTRLLMDHWLSERSIATSEIRGYDDAIEESHVAVAATIASGAADVGPGVEAAALEFGLHFVPLVAEDYFLACLKEQLDHPEVVHLRDLLASADWAAVLASLPGYTPARAPGAVLAMTGELPWWRFTKRKADAPAG